VPSADSGTGSGMRGVRSAGANGVNSGSAARMAETGGRGGGGGGAGVGGATDGVSGPAREDGVTGIESEFESLDSAQQEQNTPLRAGAAHTISLRTCNYRFSDVWVRLALRRTKRRRATGSGQVQEQRQVCACLSLEWQRLMQWE
jgi:hypothetical protein